MIRHSLTAAALAAVIAVPAFAQQQTQPSATPPAPATQNMQQNNNATGAGATSGTMATDAAKKPGFAQNQSSNEWRASKIIGTSVYGPDNASIGEINDVIIGSDGQFKAAIVGVGGFLGMGEKNVALPFEALNVQRKKDAASIDKITVTYTKDELKNAPKFAYYEPSGSSATTGSSGTAPATTTAPATRK